MPRRPPPGAAAMQQGLPPGLQPPPVRKPSRGALGGVTPRAGRTRLPPEMAPAGRGGKKKKPIKRGK